MKTRSHRVSPNHQGATLTGRPNEEGKNECAANHALLAPQKIVEASMNETRNVSPPSTGHTSVEDEYPPPPTCISDKSTSGEWVPEWAPEDAPSSPDKVSKPSLYVPPSERISRLRTDLHAEERSATPVWLKSAAAILDDPPLQPQQTTASPAQPPPAPKEPGGSQAAPAGASAGQKASRFATPTLARGAVVIALTAAAAAAAAGRVQWGHTAPGDPQPPSRGAEPPPTRPGASQKPEGNGRSRYSPRQCSEWAGRGECERNAGFMTTHCAPWCATDVSPRCAGWASAGECTRNPAFMGTTCARSCAMRAMSEPKPAREEDAQARPGPGKGVPQPADPPASLRPLEDRDARCTTWAAGGECDRNQAYMSSHCANSCAQMQQPAPTDSEPQCARWSSMGECERNPNFMALRCARACSNR